MRRFVVSAINFFGQMFTHPIEYRQRKCMPRPGVTFRTRLGVEEMEVRLVPATVQGIVYDDANRDGIREAGEALVTAGTVELDQGAGGFVTTINTDESYQINGVPLGVYILKAQAADGVGSLQDSGPTILAGDPGEVVTRDVGLIYLSPVISVTKLNDATEGGTDGTFEFARTGDRSSSLTLTYTIGGTATSGTDYTALSGQVTFAPGSATADVDVSAIDNVKFDSSRTVSVTLPSGAGYTVGGASSATMNIIDDEATPDYWVGLTGASWSDPANWTAGVPTSTTAVYFSGSYGSVTIPDGGSGSTQFAELHLVGGYSGTVTLSNNLTVRDLELTSGAVNQPSTSYGTDLTVTAAMIWTGGTLNSSTNLATLTIDGATARIAPAGGGTVNLGDNITLAGGAVATLKEGTVLATNENEEIDVGEECGMEADPGADKGFKLDVGPGIENGADITIKGTSWFRVLSGTYTQKGHVLNNGEFTLMPGTTATISGGGNVWGAYEQSGFGTTAILNLYGGSTLVDGGLGTKPISIGGTLCTNYGDGTSDATIQAPKRPRRWCLRYLHRLSQGWWSPQLWDPEGPGKRGLERGNLPPLRGAVSGRRRRVCCGPLRCLQSHRDVHYHRRETGPHCGRSPWHFRATGIWPRLGDDPSSDGHHEQPGPDIHHHQHLDNPPGL